MALGKEAMKRRNSLILKVFRGFLVPLKEHSFRLLPFSAHGSGPCGLISRGGSSPLDRTTLTINELLNLSL
jgi:hypothetical protein